MIGHACSQPTGLPPASWDSYQCHVEFKLLFCFSYLLGLTSLCAVNAAEGKIKVFFLNPCLFLISFWEIEKSGREIQRIFPVALCFQ